MPKHTLFIAQLFMFILCASSVSVVTLLCGDSKSSSKQAISNQKGNTPVANPILNPIIVTSTPTLSPSSPIPMPVSVAVPTTPSEINLLKSTVKAAWTILRAAYLLRLGYEMTNWFQAWQETEGEGSSTTGSGIESFEIVGGKVTMQPCLYILNLLTVGGFAASSLYHDYFTTPMHRRHRSLKLDNHHPENDNSNNTTPELTDNKTPPVTSVQS